MGHNADHIQENARQMSDICHINDYETAVVEHTHITLKSTAL